MIARRLVAAIAALLLAVVIVRNAAVAAWSDTNPERAAQWWSGHPAAELALAQARIGKMAGAGIGPDPATLARLETAASSAPMAAEPVIAQGVAAQLAGDLGRAERLFRIAEQRQARLLSPHYFLADLYLRQGRVDQGLRELVNFSRLAPGGISAAAPFIAGYAREPANWPRIRPILQQRPALGRSVLDVLAADPANAQALMALTTAEQRLPSAPWIGQLLDAMIKSGKYGEAFELAGKLGRIQATRGGFLRDPDFRNASEMPPFGWQLIDSAVGVAERRAGGGLHAIFYGSQSGNLVRQLLLLRPGRYRLAADAKGRIGDPGALVWTVWCGQGQILAEMLVQPGATRAVDLTVPATCAAQWLELRTRAQDIAGDSDVVIPEIRLERLIG